MHVEVIKNDLNSTSGSFQQLENCITFLSEKIRHISLILDRFDKSDFDNFNCDPSFKFSEGCPFLKILKDLYFVRTTFLENEVIAILFFKYF
jgi:hypothetical protein